MEAAEHTFEDYPLIHSDKEDDLDFVANFSKNRKNPSSTRTVLKSHITTTQTLLHNLCPSKIKYICIALLLVLVVFGSLILIQVYSLERYNKANSKEETSSTFEGPFVLEFNQPWVNPDVIKSGETVIPVDHMLGWFMNPVYPTEPPVSTTSFVPKFLGMDANELYQVDTQVIKKTADYMLSNINISVNPCDNFYQFACQGWMQQHTSKLETGWDVLQDLENKTKWTYIDILEEPVQNRDFQALKYSKGFFKVCNVNEALKYYGRENYINETFLPLEAYGGWPILYEKGNWMSNLFSWKGINALFTNDSKTAPIFLVNVHTTKLTISKVEISPPKTFFGNNTANFSLSQIEDFVVHFAKHFMNSMLSNETFDEKFARHQVREILDVGKRLSGFVNNSWKENRAGLSEMSLEELLLFVDKELGFKAMTQLTDILENYLAQSGGVTSYRNLTCFVTNMNYLLQAINLTASLTEQELANYLMFTYFSNKFDLPTKTMEMDSETPISALEEKDKKTCLKEVLDHFKYIMEHEFAKRQFKSEIEFNRRRDQVEYIFWNILKGLKRLMTSSKIESKAEIIKRVDKTRLCFGFSNWIFNESLVYSEYFGLNIFEDDLTYDAQIRRMSKWKLKRKSFVQELDDPNCPLVLKSDAVGAMGETDELRIHLPMGILQPPIFELDRPMAINFGALGTVLGHEISHLFAGLGWLQDTYDVVQPQGACVMKHYGKFLIVNDTEFGEVRINTQETFREDFSDSASILLAYSAYKEENSKLNSTNRDWHGFEKHGDDKLFFLAFAQNWCQSISDTGLINTYYKYQNDYSPDMFRTLGPLQNSPEFATAWNCLPETNMNPVTKCDIFNYSQSNVLTYG